MTLAFPLPPPSAAANVWTDTVLLYLSPPTHVAAATQPPPTQCFSLATETPTSLSFAQRPQPSLSPPHRLGALDNDSAACTAK